MSNQGWEMKILFLTHYYTPEGNAPASRVSALAKRWVAAGHDVTVITCAPNVPNGIVYPGYRNQWRKTEIIDGVRVIRVWTYIAPNKGTVRRILNFLSYMFSATLQGLFVKRPDILIATSPQFFCGWAGVLLHWVRRIPFVLEIRDIWPESMSAVDAGLPSPILKALCIMERMMYRSANHIVTVGQGYVEKLRERNVPEKNISVIMNGVDKKLFYPREKNIELLKRYHLEGKFVCSYIGTIGMACGLGTALDAAEKLKKAGDDTIRFVLVGDGANREILEKEAKSRNLNNVVFTGRLPKENIPDLVASSDVNLVHLKKNDLFTTVMPSKIFESAGCARPILMGVDGFAKKLVLDAGAGIGFEPENSEELVAGLLFFRDHPEECKKMGDNAFNHIAKQYDRDTQAQKYVEILKSVIAK